ncbi:MotE family protein [Halobacillus salinus]|uniref:Magnesium transporter MgtE intracellular domain-containing protein n=1 Tax=Halobacillus salinus TaxID=192814 RepID=A0A4Z0H6X9_9BACI|nr:MotE family protein [Halobacillus salinus]TGB04805.1 hypothetical protein E4663_07380 [Halobacillus salinus]
MAKSEQAKHGGNKLQWFFFVIVIPVVFAITLALAIFTLLGINVFEQAEKYANQVPGLSQMVTTEDEKVIEGQTSELEATIANNNAQIEQLEQEVSGKDATIDDLNLQIEKLEKELESSKEAKEDTSEQVSDLATSFQGMDAEQAAPILSNMSEALAIDVLQEISSEERGEILGAMDPEVAASLASSFLGSPSP